MIELADVVHWSRPALPCQCRRITVVQHGYECTTNTPTITSKFQLDTTPDLWIKPFLKRFANSPWHSGIFFKCWPIDADHNWPIVCVYVKLLLFDQGCYCSRRQTCSSWRYQTANFHEALHILIGRTIAILKFKPFVYNWLVLPFYYFAVQNI